MVGEIENIPPGSDRLITDELSSYDLAGFLDSRSQMTRIFRDHGLAAVQRHMNTSAYIERT